MISIQISKPITSLFSLNCRMKQYQEHFRNTLIRWPTKQLVRPGERWSEFLKLSWVRGLELFTKLSLSPFLFLSIPKSLLVSCLSLPFLSLAQSLSFAVLPKQSLSISLFSFSLKNSLCFFDPLSCCFFCTLNLCLNVSFTFSISYSHTFSLTWIKNCLSVCIYLFFLHYFTLSLCFSLSDTFLQILTQSPCIKMCLFLKVSIFTSFTRSLSVCLSIRLPFRSLVFLFLVHSLSKVHFSSIMETKHKTVFSPFLSLAHLWIPETKDEASRTFSALTTIFFAY